MEPNPFTKILDRRFRVSFSVRTVLLCASVAILCFYLVWEIYWYRKVGLACVKWHTHLMVYAFLFALGYAFFRGTGFRYKRVQRILFSIGLGLFFMEVLLLVWGRFDTHSEKNRQGYQSPFEPSSSYYHTGNKELAISRPEFEYVYPLNSLGFPDREWELPENEEGTKRILALGDSFTHGDGDAYGGSYVFRLGKLLNGRENIDTPYYMMNGGFCGSDPFFNYMNLRDRLLPYSPDMVIQVVSSHDMLDDYGVRGGLERFLPEGKIAYRPAPWWEPLWAVSHIVRVVMSLEGYEQPFKRTPELASEARNALIDLFAGYAELCRQEEIPLLVVIRPDRHEVIRNRYDFDFSSLKSYLAERKNVYVFDLLPYYGEYVSRSGTAIDKYYWQQDPHHNAAGYQMMAEGIYGVLKPILDTNHVSEEQPQSYVDF